MHSPSFIAIANYGGGGVGEGGGVGRADPAPSPGSGTPRTPRRNGINSTSCVFSLIQSS